jgi:ABC-type siderophore export system fused ATPase/permease subunit
MDIPHTIRGATRGIIAHTISSSTIAHTMPMSTAIILGTATMAITIAPTMVTIIVVTIATAMATDERTIAHTYGVVATARIGDSDGRATVTATIPGSFARPQ